MSKAGRRVGGTRKRGFGRCGIKPKRENTNYVELKKAIEKALARIEGVSVGDMRKANKAKAGATIYGKKTKRSVRENV